MPYNNSIGLSPMIAEPTTIPHPKWNEASTLLPDLNQTYEVWVSSRRPDMNYLLNPHLISTLLLIPWSFTIPGRNFESQNVVKKFDAIFATFYIFSGIMPIITSVSEMTLFPLKRLSMNRFITFSSKINYTSFLKSLLVLNSDFTGTRISSKSEKSVGPSNSYKKLV